MKKKYFKPEMEVYEIEPAQLLSGSRKVDETEVNNGYPPESNG